MTDMAQLTLNVYDGTRRLVDSSLNLLITITDGVKKQLFRDDKRGPTIDFKVPFHNNATDNYAVVVYADNHVQAGFHPVHVSRDNPTVLDLMLLPSGAGFDFTEASWAKLEANYNLLFRILSSGVSPGEAEARYEDFMQKSPGSLAAFLNVTTAARDVICPNGKAALGYFKEMIWDEKRMGEDRFFLYADAELVAQIKEAAAKGKFDGQSALDTNHPGATSSYKQKQFGEANIQFSFHERDKKDLAGVSCCKVELDMDYYESFLSHALLEVLPNKVSKGKTDPRQIYVLRWIAGRRAGVPEFDPPYTIGFVA